MKKKNIEEEELIDLLNLLEPKRLSEDSSKKIVEMVQQQQWRKSKGQSIFERYFGKFVLLVLLGANLLFFMELRPFDIDPISSLGVIAFITGAGSILFFLKYLKLDTTF